MIIHPIFGTNGSFEHLSTFYSFYNTRLDFERAYLQWPPFDQNSPFSVLAKHKLLRICPANLAATRRKERPRLLGYRINDFLSFQKRFIISNNQPALVEWSPFDQKRHLLLWASGPFSVLTTSSLPQPKRGAPSTSWLSNCGLPEFQTTFLRTTINLPW